MVKQLIHTKKHRILAFSKLVSLYLEILLQMLTKGKKNPEKISEILPGLIFSDQF
jgi:hypothetical protein